MESMNFGFIAARLRLRDGLTTNLSHAALFSGDVRLLRGIVIFDDPIFGASRTTSLPISRGDPPTP